MDDGPTGAVTQVESSQRTIQRLNEPGLLAPAVAPPRAIAVEKSKPVESPAPQKVELFYCDGSRMERWKVWVSSIPLSFMLGLGFYLDFTGTREWLAGAVMLAGFFVFGLFGLLIERQMLKAFECPGCKAPIQDWDTNDEHRIFFNCARCESRWDIEYKRQPPEPDLRNRLLHSHVTRLFSSEGAQ